MNTFHWRQVIDIWRLAIKCPEKLWRALRGDGGARTSTNKNTEMEEPQPRHKNGCSLSKPHRSQQHGRQAEASVLKRQKFKTKLLKLFRKFLIIFVSCAYWRVCKEIRAHNNIAYKHS